MTADKSKKQGVSTKRHPNTTAGDKQIYHDEDFNIDSAPLHDWSPSESDGWSEIGEGCYRKPIPSADMF